MSRTYRCILEVDVYCDDDDHDGEFFRHLDTADHWEAFTDDCSGRVVFASVDFWTDDG